MRVVVARGERVRLAVVAPVVALLVVVTGCSVFGPQVSETAAEQDLREIADIGQTVGGDRFTLDGFPRFTCEGGAGEPGARYTIRTADTELLSELVAAYQQAGWAPEGASTGEAGASDDEHRLQRREDGYDTLIAIKLQDHDEIRVTAVISKNVCPGD